MTSPNANSENFHIGNLRRSARLSSKPKKSQSKSSEEDHCQSKKGEMSKPKEGISNNEKSEKKERRVYQTKFNRQESDSSRIMHSYSLDGQKRVRHVSQHLLRERLLSFFEKKIETKTEDEKNEDNEDKEVENVNNGGRRYRYFNYLLKGQSHRKVTKCYRCGKEGHISSRCIEQRTPTKCYYCLKNHHCNLCQAFIMCNRCGETGHIEYECNTTNIINCKKCKRKGHLESKCGTVQMQRFNKDSLDSIKDSKEYDLKNVDPKDIKNLRCLNNCEHQYGHFRCYNINTSQDYPYEKYGSTASEVYEFPENTQQSSGRRYAQLEEY